MVPLFCVVIIAVLCGLVVPAPTINDDGFYSTKYDHVDIDMILNNQRLINYYTNCMLDKGPCPPDGADFKRILPDALKTNCERCTDKQKVKTLRTIKRLMKEYPKIWEQLQEAWDPKRIYVHKFISTYSNWESMPAPAVPTPKPALPTPKPATPMIVFDRFGDEESTEKTTSKVPPITTTSRTSFSSTLGVFIPPLPTLPQLPPPELRPIANTIGEGIKATVSLGTNIVGQVIKGIEDIGNRVVETGAGIVGAFRNIGRPLRRLE